MSDNRRRYLAMKRALKQLYPIADRCDPSLFRPDNED